MISTRVRDGSREDRLRDAEMLRNVLDGIQRNITLRAEIDEELSPAASGRPPCDRESVLFP